MNREEVFRQIKNDINKVIAPELTRRTGFALHSAISTSSPDWLTFEFSITGQKGSIVASGRDSSENIGEATDTFKDAFKKISNKQQLKKKLAEFGVIR